MRPSTTAHAIKAISEEKDISEAVVRVVVQSFIQKMIDCLSLEVPFQIHGFGKFYFRYRQGLAKPTCNSEYFKDKVRREVAFRLTDLLRSKLNAWVHDLDLKNNLPGELMRVAIKPDEIHKIRRRKLLEDQRTLGFRPDLLFDDRNLPPSDEATLARLGAAPSVEEIAARIGLNLQEG